MNNFKLQIKLINHKLYGQISAFICVHLRLIFVSLNDRIRKNKIELFPFQEKIELANNKKTHSYLNGLTESPQKGQSLAIPVTKYEKATASRFRTRITRIFTDRCASASSAYRSKNKPQINADERRLIDPASEFISLFLVKSNFRSNYS